MKKFSLLLIGIVAILIITGPLLAETQKPFDPKAVAERMKALHENANSGLVWVNFDGIGYATKTPVGWACATVKEVIQSATGENEEREYSVYARLVKGANGWRIIRMEYQGKSLAFDY